MTTIMQLTSVALIGSSEPNGNHPIRGYNILLAGLAIQTLSFTLFFFFIIILLLKQSASLSAKMSARGATYDVKIHSYMQWRMRVS